MSKPMVWIFRELNGRIYCLIFWAFALGAQGGAKMTPDRILITIGIACGVLAMVLGIIRYERSQLPPGSGF